MDRPPVSRVGLFGVGLILAALFFGDFLIVRPNRLAAGEQVALFSAIPFWGWSIVLLLPAAMGWCFFRPERWRLQLAAVLAAFYLILLLWWQGWAAAEVSAAAGEYARVSLGSGFWLSLAGAFIAVTESAQRGRPGGLFTITVTGGTVLVLASLSASGFFESLSLVQEFLANRQRFFAELADHLFITTVSVLCSACIGIPLGIFAFRQARLRTAVFSVLNIVQTIPSLALFGLLIAPLALLSARIEMFRDLGIRGIGWAPAVTALTLYALLPIVRNTFSGFAAVDDDVLEAGRGMGMGGRQMFFRIELPLAAPIVINGLRIAVVQNIGNTAVAALIGAGGFGVFIFQGLGQSAIDLVLLGALPTILLAAAADLGFQKVIVFLTPRGSA